MTTETEQWVRKAEAHYDIVLLLCRPRKPSRFDAIRFHSQQCAVKYLKARLQEAGVRVPRMHDLTSLLSMLKVIEPTWQRLHAEVAVLGDAAMESHRQTNRCGAGDAREAYDTCRRLRMLARLQRFSPW